MNKPYDVEGRIVELEAEISLLRIESGRLAIENMNVINVLMNMIYDNGLNKPIISRSDGRTYVERLDDIFLTIDKIISRDDG